MTDDELNRIVDKVVDRIVDKNFNSSFIDERINKKLSEDTRLTLIGLLEDSYEDIVREATNLVLSNINIDQVLLDRISKNRSFRYEISRIISMELPYIQGGILDIMNDRVHRLESRINYLESRNKY